MKIIKRVSDFTVEISVIAGQDFSMVQGQVYSLIRERDPVQFSIENRAMSGSPINPVKEVRMPPVLVSNRIPIALRAADVANAECDLYLDIIATIQEGDAQSLISGLFDKHDWSRAGHVLGLTQLIPDAMTKSLADHTLTRLLEAARNDGALDSRGRMVQRLGGVLYTQMEALSLIASDAVINQCDAYLDLRERAQLRAS